MDEGARGLFSEKFVNAVGSRALQSYVLLLALLNNSPYYFLRCERAVDCLDHVNSVFETFDDDGKLGILSISHYAFHADHVWEESFFACQKPLCFFPTERMVRQLSFSNLKGLQVRCLP